ncbi:hypothetical protein SAMN05443634_105201 [Chishuiella changwenlii]|uniref:Uncharacterized protein n=1 Tax=Chishuiella changwenlii TaxID=1434701 RepID=A0A1M6XCU9_9FLAO|nr:hypothetical protein [Chishuiella changwenlii]GGF00450.1 hypothetical protein GCM10010984_17540 [Chishuiella changwenlii]SHL03743.1 hypothetical protein SAMN05443634_105201 [Chishuiella changwenlii]
MEKGRKLSKIYESFENGIDQIKTKDSVSFRKEVMKQLSISSNTAFYKRIKGHRGHSLAEVAAINKLFEKFGVTENIWSEPTPEPIPITE